MNRNIIKGIITISALSIFFTGCSIEDINISNGSNFSAVKYSKEDTSEYSYELTGNRLELNSDTSSLTIKKDNVDKVQIKINKKVGGNDEEKLQIALDNIKAECFENIINISSPNLEEDDFSAINNECEIIIPDTIDDLKIKNSVGDIIMEGNYETLDVDSKTGDISYTGSSDNLDVKNDIGDILLNGEIKVCSINSNIGDIKMYLKDLKDDYNYLVRGRVGDLNINIPKESSIQLKGNFNNKSKLGKGVNIGEEGAVFDIDMKTSEISINGV